MHRLLVALLFVQLLCAWGCSQAADPHAAFAKDNGGIEWKSPRYARARTALAKLTPDLRLAPECHLHTVILHNSAYCAYSFSDGSIYLSAGIVDRLNDDELSAVIAHEIGHMLHDNVVEFPAALQGRTAALNNKNLEITADALGRQLLLEHHLPPTALATALTKVALPNTPYYQNLQHRIAILHAQDR